MMIFYTSTVSHCCDAAAPNISLGLLLCFLPWFASVTPHSLAVSVHPLVLETSSRKCAPLLSALLSVCLSAMADFYCACWKCHTYLLYVLQWKVTWSRKVIVFISAVFISWAIRCFICPVAAYCYQMMMLWTRMFCIGVSDCYVQSSVSSQNAQIIREKGENGMLERSRGRWNV